MIKPVRRAIDWLVEGLMEAWTAAAERLSPRRQLRLVRNGDSHALQQPDGRIEADGLQLGGAAAKIPPAAAALIKDSDVDLVLPEEELLVRALEPLPAQSRPYLDGIVRHQLERLTPWRTNDVLYSYEAVPAGHDDSRLNVTVAATARSLHRQEIEQIAALRPRSIRLLFRGAAGGKDVAIDVSSGGGSAERERSMRRAIGWGAAGLAAASLLACVLLALAWRNTEAALEAAEREVADLRLKLASGPAPTRGDREVEAVFERRMNTPLAVLGFDALAHSLPDDTYLTDLRIADGHVRMSGVSRAVSRLVPLLEASPSFAGATFFAPTTRLPNNQGDRFHLDARLVPPGAQKP